MLDPNDLYRNSEEYRKLDKKINRLIGLQGKRERAGDPADAATAGLEAWQYLRELMTLLQAKGVDELFGITMYDLPYWATCLSDVLGECARKDEQFVKKHLDYCQSYVRMHEGLSDRHLPNLGNIRTDLAEIYCRRGDAEYSDALYENWLRLEPDWGWGWVGWADQYSFGLWEAALKVRDLSKAEKILRRGLAVENVSNRSVLEERLETVQKDRTKAARLRVYSNDTLH